MMNPRKPLLLCAAILFFAAAPPALSEVRTGLVHLYRGDPLLGAIDISVNDVPMARIRSKESVSMEIEEGEILLRASIGTFSSAFKMDVVAGDERHVVLTIVNGFARSVGRWEIVEDEETVNMIEEGRRVESKVRVFLSGMSMIDPDSVDLEGLELGEKAKTLCILSLSADSLRSAMSIGGESHPIDAYGPGFAMTVLNGSYFFRVKLDFAVFAPRSFGSIELDDIEIDVSDLGSELSFDGIYGQGASFSKNGITFVYGLGLHIGEATLLGLGGAALLCARLKGSAILIASVDGALDICPKIIIETAKAQAFGGDPQVSSFVPSFGVGLGVALML